MKTVIHQISDKANELVTIDCCEVTQEIINLRDHAESVGGNIAGTTDGKSVILPLSDILYFEAVDEKVFAYTDSDAVANDKTTCVCNRNTCSRYDQCTWFVFHDDSYCYAWHDRSTFGNT